MNPNASNAAAYGYDPYAQIVGGDVGWFGSGIVKAVKKGYRKARKVARKVAPAVEAAWPMVKQQLAKTPYGAIGVAAYEGVKTAVKGGNLASVLESAARGAIPDEIEAALNVASDAIRGRNIVKSALKNAALAFASGTQEAAAFGQASQLLGSGKATMATLANARRALDSEGARRAFDAAVGTAAKVAQGERGKPKLATVPRVFQRATRTAPRASFAALNARAADLVARRMPGVSVASLIGRRETAGLESDAKQYRVESGDSPWAIAKKLVGDGNRWRELVGANPKKPVHKTGANAGSFTQLWAGELLALPASWTAKLAPKMSADVLSQARAIIKIWSESDGKDQAGVTDYGGKPEDSALVWGPRDRLMLQSFLNWWNRVKNAGLPVSVSELTTQAADALRQWAAEHAVSKSTPVPAKDDSGTNTPTAPERPSVPTPAPGIVSPIGGDANSRAPLPVYGEDEITRAPTQSYLMPSDVQALIDAGMRSTDPAQIRAIAGQIRGRGLEATHEGPDYVEYAQVCAKAADDLDLLADKLEAKQMGVPDPRPDERPQVIPMQVDGQAPKKSDDGLLWLGLGAAALKIFGAFG